MRQMGRSADRIAEAVAGGSLFFVVRDGQRYFPSFFIGRTRQERRHLTEVMRLPDSVDGLAKWLFFTTPKGSLGAVTPLDAMGGRRFAAVKRTAEGFAQR